MNFKFIILNLTLFISLSFCTKCSELEKELKQYGVTDYQCDDKNIDIESMKTL